MDANIATRYLTKDKFFLANELLTLLRNLTIKGLFVFFLFLSHVSRNSETEKNMKLTGTFFLVSKIKPMAIASALKIEDLSRRHFYCYIKNG